MIGWISSTALYSSLSQISLVGVVLALMRIVETNLIRITYIALYKPLIRFNSGLKQMYISIKM